MCKQWFSFLKQNLHTASYLVPTSFIPFVFSGVTRLPRPQKTAFVKPYNHYVVCPAGSKIEQMFHFFFLSLRFLYVTTQENIFLLLSISVLVLPSVKDVNHNAHFFSENVFCYIPLSSVAWINNSSNASMRLINLPPNFNRKLLYFNNLLKLTACQTDTSK